MRLSTCFSPVEGNEKSWLSTCSISIQVTSYWCHREPWQLTVLTSQRSQDEIIRPAAESMTRPTPWGGGKTEENAPHNCKSQNAEPFWWLLGVTECIRNLKQEWVCKDPSSTCSEGASFHTWQARTDAMEPRFRPLPVRAVQNPSSLSDLYLISTLKTSMFKINMTRFL